MRILPDPTKYARRPKKRFTRSRFGPITTTLDDDSITAVGPDGRQLRVEANAFEDRNQLTDQLRAGIDVLIGETVVARLIQPEHGFARRRRAIHIHGHGDDRFPTEPSSASGDGTCSHSKHRSDD